MKIAVTITKSEQISIDEWKDFYYTNTFDESATIKEINDWIKTINKDLEIGILYAKLSKLIK